MKQNMHITYFKPEKQGVYPVNKGYLFAAESDSAEDCGLILYGKDKAKVKIPFSEEGKRGTLYGIRVEDEEGFFTEYNYYHGEQEVTDAYAGSIAGLERFGEITEKPRETRGVLTGAEFDWEGDKPPGTAYKDTVIYGLNVRGFTMHKSSGVRNKGTFEGVAEKTGYLKELGVTAIELMPAYEFDECLYAYPLPGALDSISEKHCGKINCWGYQPGFYFAPKASYAVEQPEISFKKMVRTLHKSGIEVMMQFYFPPELKPAFILEVIKYWVITYHIDGVRVCGFHIPYEMLAQDPVLKETKIRSASFPIEEIYEGKEPVHRNLVMDSYGFRSDMRRFLKGDENLIGQVLFYQKNNPPTNAVVNFMADYDGFSLYDSVSYERKHNEANGEDNRDGADNNFTWNCGAEGESRKKAVVSLRMQQMKNALALVFLSQGVPYLFSGDEFANTRFGNNNAYCQDNDVWYVKWKTNKFGEEIYSFTKELIAFRRQHRLLHMEKELKVMDSLGCGYPDISYHGTEAWRPDVGYSSRMAGIMLCGSYAEEQEEESVYIACNMHWLSHTLALPKLPKNRKWVLAFSTAPQKEDMFLPEENKVLAEGRSISVYLAKDTEPSDKIKKREKNTDNESMESFENRYTSQKTGAAGLL
jgi:glycogen operon protein